ncbi:MAG: ABC transporter permease [Anaerolineae bacterium]|nr:ABC transporter permease [Anaerolineae bacterium]
MVHRLLAIMRKEIIHIRRDPRTLAVMFLIPLIQMILLGYAATTDIKRLKTAVLDLDRTKASRELIDAYRASNYFNLVYFTESEEELTRLIESGKARAGLIIPAGYSLSLSRGEKASVYFIIDGSDPNVANTAFAASQSVAHAFSFKLVALKSSPIVEAIPRVWYNPEMRSSNFMIPGLIGLIMALITTILTALAIVREKEQGTVEQLMVTPIRPLELLAGKIAPYVAIAFLELGEVLIVGHFWFKVPIRGSIPLLLALSFLFLFATLGIGLFISSVAHTQREAMFLAFFVILPSIFLSGFIFPIEAMPRALQIISYIIPLRYYMSIVRGIILKGTGLEALVEHIVPLAFLGAAIFAGATLRIRKRLE